MDINNSLLFLHNQSCTTDAATIFKSDRGNLAGIERVSQILTEADDNPHTDHKTYQYTLVSINTLAIDQIKQLEVGIVGKIIDCVMRIFCKCCWRKRIFSRQRLRHSFQELHELCKAKIRFIPMAKQDTVETHFQAQCLFYNNFQNIFKCKAEGLVHTEVPLINKISKRIWESRNVQILDHDKQYAFYEKLMTEFFVGTHMLFEEDDKESMLSELEQEIGTGKNRVEQRISSHYGPIGSEIQRHIRGKQLPETLFFHGTFALQEGDFKECDSNIVPGKYAPKDFAGRTMRAFWIQTERNADGPDWGSYLKQRTLDFIQYFYLKKVLKRARPQIANYVGPLGRGLPDTDPVVIRLCDKASRRIPEMTTKLDMLQSQRNILTVLQG